MRISLHFSKYTSKMNTATPTATATTTPLFFNPKTRSNSIPPSAGPDYRWGWRSPSVRPQNFFFILHVFIHIYRVIGSIFEIGITPPKSHYQPLFLRFHHHLPLSSLVGPVSRSFHQILCLLLLNSIRKYPQGGLGAWSWPQLIITPLSAFQSLPIVRKLSLLIEGWLDRY